MKVAFACDHAGFPIKDLVTDTIKKMGHEVLDFGTFSEQSVDYPDFAATAAQAVSGGEAWRAVIVCGSGIGACIAANKFKGVRASVAHDLYSAAQGVEHDDMNALCLGCRVIGKEAPKFVEAFLNAKFQKNEERHVRRLNKILAIEEKNFK